MPKILYISIVMLYLSQGSRSLASPSANDCDEIKCTWIITDTFNSLDNGSISFKFETERSTLQVYMINREGRIPMESSKNSFDNLKRGKYLIVITGNTDDTKLCQKPIEFSIK